MLAGFCLCPSCSSCDNITTVAMVEEVFAYESDSLTLVCGESGHYTRKKEPVGWMMAETAAGFTRKVEDMVRSYMQRVVFSSLVVGDSGVYECEGRKTKLTVKGKGDCSKKYQP